MGLQAYGRVRNLRRYLSLESSIFARIRNYPGCEAKREHSLHRSQRRRALGRRPAPGKALLDCGNTRLYELLNSEELESYLGGRSRKITVSSIKAHIARRLAAGANHHTSAVAAARKRANHASKNRLASNIADETI
jgi:hypothetical protein